MFSYNQPVEQVILENQKEEISTYSIQYYLNGGKIAKPMPNKYIRGDYIELSIPTKTGYIFNGWFDNKDLTGKSIKIIDKKFMGNLNLYASWKINQYDVSFYDGNELLQKKSFSYNSKIKNIDEPLKKGYRFKKWNKNFERVIKDEEYFAIWDLEEYQIIYNLNGGFLEKTVDSYTIESKKIILPTPTKKGYHFIGWTDDFNSIPTLNISLPSGSNGNKKYIANWSAKEYNIEYELNDGTLEDTKNTYNIECDDILIPHPFKDGYSFMGWTTDESIIPDLNVKIKKGSIGDKKYIANWQPIEYKINYDLQGGILNNPIESYTIESDEITLSAPSKAGYHFIGWTSDLLVNPTLNVIISSGTSGNKNFIAVWKPIDYFITYHLDSGRLNSKIDCFNIESERINLTNPIKEGYRFIGWLIHEDLAPQYNISIPKGSIGNQEFWAKWEPISYDIIYDLNGGIMNSFETSYTIESNSIEIVIPTKAGYKFLGWTTDKNSVPDLKPVIETGSIGNKHFYAKWEVINYHITYDLQNGIFLDSAKESYTIEDNSFALAIPEKKGYIFIGWTSVDCPIPTINIILRKGTLGDKTYIANWQPVKYNIGYDLNGGRLNNLITSYTIETDDIVLSHPIRQGYKFLGWTTNSEETPIIDMTLKKGNIGNKRFIANWQPIQYTISYNLNGGTLSNYPKSYNIESSTITIPVPTRTGYTFSGWGIDNDSIPQHNVSIPKGSIGNKNYIAKWTIKSYVVTYLKHDNSVYSTKRVNYNDAIPQPGYEPNHPYVFTGWKWNGNNINDIKMPTNDITVIASVRETTCYLLTGQVTDGDNSRITRFEELLLHKGLSGYWNKESTGNYSYASYGSNYSHVLDSANYLLDNAPRNSWPYLRWLLMSCDNGYSLALR